MRAVDRRVARAGLVAIGLAVSALSVTACGLDTSSDIVQSDRQAASAREDRQREDAASAARRREELPSRPPGALSVAMRVPDTITGQAIRKAGSGPSPIRYAIQVNEPGASIRDLCAGRIDLVQTSRKLTAAELSACAANGLQVNRPVTIGYATAILVTRNGTDIGGDCLTLGGVKSLLAVNSTVTNWRQIGFADQPFAVATPPAESPVMQAIGHLALGFPIGGLSAENLRSGLQIFTDQSDIGAFIAGDDRLVALDRTVRSYTERLTQERQAADAYAVARAERAAARRVVDRIEAENRRRARAGESVADPAALEAANAKRVADAKRRAAHDQRLANRRSINRAAATYRREHLPGYLGDGRLGVVGYPYYEAHSDVLRPLEIDPRTRSAAGSQPECRFPSQHTIANGDYPLVLPIYLYGDDRTLRGAPARPLLRTLLDYNAELTRNNDVAGLSAAVVATTRRQLGLGAQETTESPSSPASTVTTPAPAPTPAPGGIPGVDAPQATP